MTIGISGLLHRAAPGDEILAVVIAAILAGLGALIVRFVISRGKIGWGISHQCAFTLPNQPQNVVVYTRQLWVQNIGWSVARQVEIIFNFKPGHFEVWPQTPSSEHAIQTNRYLLRFDNLNPRQHVTVMLMQIDQAPPDVTTVRWNRGIGKQVMMGPRQLIRR